MAEKQQQQEEGQKTFISFIIGLFIGGMLVWAFSAPSTEKTKTNTTAAGDKENVESKLDYDKDDSKDASKPDDSENKAMDNADSAVSEKIKETFKESGDIKVSDQPAGIEVKMDKAIYPISEGWVGVREYDAKGELSYILGVVRFSEKYNMVPDTIVLQRPTTAGRTYAVVVFSEDGDGSFNVYKDIQVGEPLDTFKAE